MASQGLRLIPFLALVLIIKLALGCSLHGYGNSYGSSYGSTSGHKSSGLASCCPPPPCCTKPCQTVFIRGENCCNQRPCSETLIVQEDSCSPCRKNPCCQLPCGLHYNYYSLPCCSPYSKQCCQGTRILVKKPEQCCSYPSCYNPCPSYNYCENSSPSCCDGGVIKIKA